MKVITSCQGRQHPSLVIRTRGIMYRKLLAHSLSLQSSSLNMAFTATVAADDDKAISTTDSAARQLSADTMADGQHGAVEELGLAATESAAVQEGEKQSFNDEVQYRTMGWFQAGAGKLNLFGILRGIHGTEIWSNLLNALNRHVECNSRRRCRSCMKIVDVDFFRRSHGRRNHLPGRPLTPSLPRQRRLRRRLAHDSWARAAHDVHWVRCVPAQD